MDGQLAARQSEKTMKPRETRRPDHRLAPVIEALEAGMELAHPGFDPAGQQRRRRANFSRPFGRGALAVQRVPSRERLDRITKKNHQGIVAGSSSPM